MYIGCTIDLIYIKVLDHTLQPIPLAILNACHYATAQVSFLPIFFF